MPYKYNPISAQFDYYQAGTVISGTNNRISKFSGAGLANSTLLDDGTTITIDANKYFTSSAGTSRIDLEETYFDFNLASNYSSAWIYGDTTAKLNQIGFGNLGISIFGETSPNVTPNTNITLVANDDADRILSTGFTKAAMWLNSNGEFKQDVEYSVILASLGQVAKTNYTTYLNQIGYGTDGTNETLVSFTAPTGARSIVFPDSSGTVALTNGVEVPLTFSTGLTRTTNTITNNLLTGVAGGQTVIGATNDFGLTYKGTTAAGTSTIAAHTFTGGNNGGTTIATLYNSGNFNIGNASNTSARIFRVGQDTAFMDLGSLIGTTATAALYMNKATPSATNYALTTSSTDTVSLNGGFLRFQIAAANKVTLDATTFTFSDAVNMVFNTSTGTKIGTATGQKIGFWNVTPIIQPANTVAIDTVLVNTGLWTSGATTSKIDNNLLIASGKTLTLGNAATTGLVAGALAALTNATITITDSTGQVYRIPCII